MNKLEILRAARDLLSDPARWIKGSLANDDGLDTWHDTEVAPGCSYCSMGAIARKSNRSLAAIRWLDRSLVVVQANDALAIAAKELFLGRVNQFTSIPVAAFNDHPLTTHSDVMRVFDHAIRLAEVEAGATSDDELRQRAEAAKSALHSATPSAAQPSTTASRTKHRNV